MPTPDSSVYIGVLIAAASAALEVRDGAIALHQEMAAEGIDLTDNTDAYQGAWRA